MNALVPHPVASILFGLAAQSLSKPAVPTERQQAARLPQQIHSVPGPDTSERPLQAEAEIKPKPTTRIYYRVTVSDSGTLEAGDVVIMLNGIVARKADAQCQDKKVPSRQNESRGHATLGAWPSYSFNPL
jgi:hypothetical protein